MLRSSLALPAYLNLSLSLERGGPRNNHCYLFITSFCTFSLSVNIYVYQCFLLSSSSVTLYESFCNLLFITGLGCLFVLVHIDLRDSFKLLPWITCYIFCKLLKDSLFSHLWIFKLFLILLFCYSDDFYAQCMNHSLVAPL